MLSYCSVIACKPFFDDFKLKHTVYPTLCRAFANLQAVFDGGFKVHPAHRGTLRKHDGGKLCELFKVGFILA